MHRRKHVDWKAFVDTLVQDEAQVEQFALKFKEVELAQQSDPLSAMHGSK